MDSNTTPSLGAVYFDGTNARALKVVLQLHGDILHIRGDGIQISVPIGQVQWPERTLHGKRVAHLMGGGSVQCPDAAAWDAWCHASGKHDSWIVTVQQSWRWVAASIVGLAGLGVALQLWGLPMAARAVVAVAPITVDESLGEAALAAMDQQLMQPSKLGQDLQERLRGALVRNLNALPAGSLPDWRLAFRHSRIGPNAFALPGGTLVLTDELVELVQGDEQVITAVLAHELGHVKHRHGLRMLVQGTVLGGLGAVVLGDFSTLLAAVPALLGQAQYSRVAEREADEYAVWVLKAASISPVVMVTLFEKLQQQRTVKGDETGSKGDSWLGIAFASHPSDTERIKYFRDAAQ
jgi:Zn-dependent protease with chaperone function